MDKITAVGLDLAKQIIQVHGIDAAGRVVLRKAVQRERLLALLAQLPRCVVGMEACSGAQSLGARADAARTRAADHGGGVCAAVSQEPGGEE